MGVLLRDVGDVAGACASFLRAIESGHPAWSPRAAIDLADVLVERGDVEDARELYELAVASGDPSNHTGVDLWARRAAGKLEILLAGQGEHGAAAAVYRRATGDGGVHERASYALNRAQELKQRGDITGAAASFREAVELGDPQHSPRAAFMLSMLEDQR
jgi:tetratricopeptide (TPR) repeat protein